LLWLRLRLHLATSRKFNSKKYCEGYTDRAVLKFTYRYQLLGCSFKELLRGDLSLDDGQGLFLL
jgi:hypothetical protein